VGLAAVAPVSAKGYGIGRLKTLERLCLAQERQQGVWQLDGKLESKLRRLGDRADKFRTRQQVLSRQLNAIHVPHEPGSWISGVYERAITTPTGKLAVIRSADTFTLAPWKPALEPLRGRAVLSLVGPNRVMWTLDHDRTLPGRGLAQ
jgi:hypothetical protein